MHTKGNKNYINLLRIGFKTIIYSSYSTHRYKELLFKIPYCYLHFFSKRFVMMVLLEMLFCIWTDSYQLPSFHTGTDKLRNWFWSSYHVFWSTSTVPEMLYLTRQVTRNIALILADSNLIVSGHINMWWTWYRNEWIWNFSLFLTSFHTWRWTSESDIPNIVDVEVYLALTIYFCYQKYFFT